jgi:thymidylate synthase
VKQYLDLLTRILDEGVRKEDRTGTGTLSVFGHQMRFDLADGFPLVTTKKVHTKSVIYELLWMLNGDTNVKFLQDNGVKIWNEWAQADFRPELGYPEGELGPVYGAMWRGWPAEPRHLRNCDGHPCECGAASRSSIDQIAEIVLQIRQNPNDRRIILSSWNVGLLHKMKLPPCHLLAQFNVTTAELSCHMYIRSWDVFLGGPFNIAQYAFLTHILAHSTGLGVGDLIVSSGDTHLYLNHLDQARQQLSRQPKALPRLMLADRGQSVLSHHHGGDISPAEVALGYKGYTVPVPFQYDDFVLKDYDPHPTIKAPISV